MRSRDWHPEPELRKSYNRKVDTNPTPDTEQLEDFAQLLREDTLFRATAVDHSSGSKQIDATVVALSEDSVYLDIGYKTEGILPLSAFAKDEKTVETGDKFRVTVKGRNLDGYYELTRQRGPAAPKDYLSLEEAFEAKGTVLGTVTGVVKGGLTVDIGMRAFLPSSRSGTRDAAELEKLVGQEVRVRITSLDLEGGSDGDRPARPDAVVDRRSVLEEEAKANSDARFSELAEGQIVSGTVRSLTSFGAFVDLNGADALLHISDIAWHRIEDPAHILSVGDQLEVQILKIDAADPAKRRIAVGLKQLQPHPWETVPATYLLGQKVTGKVTRLTDFGAFVELAPGIEGLIHISEMAWGKKVRTPSDIVKVGDHVEAVILAIDPAARRMGLGLKQALGDPFAEAIKTIHPGAVVEGKISQIMKFGAFMTLAEGVEGLIHISEITAEKRLNHPSDVLRVGETVKALVLEIDKDKRQLRLSMKQAIPTGLDDFLLEHAVGDTVTGRIIDIDPLSNTARVELGEGIVAPCHVPDVDPTDPGTPLPTSGGLVDLSQLGSLLGAKWKTADAHAKPAKPSKPAAGTPSPGQIRTFKIATLDPATKKLTLTLA
jgi:small subunit ribosomal protein S1